MLKDHLLALLRYVIKKLAQAFIWRYRPGIVAVTGSAGKTSAKLAIGAVLSSLRSVRFARGNFNNELGVPLTILGDYEKIEGWFFWPKVILRALRDLIAGTEYPDILILEYGIDRPGDMRKLISIARPNISVVTGIGEIPPHVEFFPDPEALAREKVRILECLPASGFAVLNNDNDVLMSYRDRTRAHVITFGYDRGANVELTGFAHVVRGDEPRGLEFRLAYGGQTVPIRIDGVFGRTQAYAVGAAASVGLIFGMSLPGIAEALKTYRPADHRMNLCPGVKSGTFVIDDSYNASPMSMAAALETLKSLPAKRRIAVLGDMLEIGKYAMQAHEAIGQQAAEAATILVTVGMRGKLIAEAARKAGMRKANIYSFDEAADAHSKVQELMKKGDLVLVKASRGIHLDEVVNEIIAKPEKPED